MTKYSHEFRMKIIQELEKGEAATRVGKKVLHTPKSCAQMVGSLLRIRNPRSYRCKSKIYSRIQVASY